MTNNQEKEFKQILVEKFREHTIRGISDGFIAGITFVSDKIKSGMDKETVLKECDLILKNSKKIYDVAVDIDKKS